MSHKEVKEIAEGLMAKHAANWKFWDDKCKEVIDAMIELHIVLTKNKNGR